MCSTWIMENLLRLSCLIVLLRLIQLIMTFFCKAYTDILRFLTQPFFGFVHICQTDTKELTYQVHARAPNYVPFGVPHDLSPVLFFSTYNTNNNDFLCANILEDQAQWRDKTKVLSNCVNVEQCVSC